MSGKIEQTMSILLAASAVVFAGVLVKREFFDAPVSSSLIDESKAPSRVPNWEELQSNALPVWLPRSRVVVLEFADLECPACKQFHTRLKQAAAESHADVGLLFVHYPLSIHRFAGQAARALECVAPSGFSSRFVDLAYSKQDSFGLKLWVAYAKEAGVLDTAAFTACVRDTATIDRIEKGRIFGEKLKIRGTPLIIINGWRFYHVPSDAELRQVIRNVMAGKAPLGTTGSTAKS